MIQEVKVESGLQEFFDSAIEKIEKVLGYNIELTDSRRGLEIITEEYKKDSLLGQHQALKNRITISSKLLSEVYEEDNIEWEETWNLVERTLIHELAHRIHSLHFDFKTIRLPKEGKTRYAEKDSKENFAEAFENLILDSDKPRFNKRSEAIRRALDNKFKEEELIEPTAAKTIPQIRKKLLTLSELCETRVHMTTKSARVKLRKSGKYNKGPAGWAWDINTQADEIEEIAKFLLGEDK